jgi:hypothetical protein
MKMGTRTRSIFSILAMSLVWIAVSGKVLTIRGLQLFDPGYDQNKDYQEDGGINPGFYPPLIQTRLPNIFNDFSCSFACSGFRMCLASQRIFTYVECGTGPTGCSC